MLVLVLKDPPVLIIFFFFNDTATTEIYTLSLHDALPIFEDHGLRILVDNQSLPYVDGSSIDYVDSLQGAGFQVNNPNVVAACGCGSSFRVAEDEQVSAV